jgi:adenylate cyclase
MAPAKKAISSAFQLRWVLLLSIPLLWGLLDHYGVLQVWENQSLDARFRYRGEIPAKAKVVYVDIDTPAVEAMGERPWSRSLFADATAALLEAGKAKAVGIDIVLSRISRSGLVDEAKARQGNINLRQVLLKHPQSVVLAAQYTAGAAVTQDSDAPRQIPLLRKGDTDRTKNDVPEMPENGFVLAATGPIGRVGLIDVDTEYSGDATPRWVPMFVDTTGPTLYHMSLQLVLQNFGLSEKSVHVKADRIDVIRPDNTLQLSIPLREGQLLEANWFSHWQNDDLNPRVSLSEIFAAIEESGSEKPPEREEARQFFTQFKDAIVLIGPTDSLLQDLAPTPFDRHPVPKVGLHGNLVKTILSGRYLVHTPAWLMWVAVFGLTAIVSVLAVAGGSRSVVAKVFAVAAVAGYVFLALQLFARADLVLPMTAPLGAAFTTSFGAVIWQLISEEKAKGRIKGMFGTYLAPTVVEQMIESGKDPELGGHDAEITAYFSDIQSFSSFSEVMSSAKLGELLNEFLTACTDIVQGERGTLDKYIGDAVVAMYGAPVEAPDHAYRACSSALLVQKRVAELREKWRSEGDKWPTLVHNLRTRIGLNTGVSMIGNFGSNTRFNYTMMGDNVNLAARMESGAKSWGVYTMCAESTKLAAQKVNADALVFRALGRIVVKGRTQPVPIYEVVGLRDEVSDQMREGIALFEQALQKYWARDWDGALALFEKSRDLEWHQPGRDAGVATNPSIIYLTKIVDETRSEKPGPDWDGRYVMPEK